MEKAVQDHLIISTSRRQRDRRTLRNSVRAGMLGLFLAGILAAPTVAWADPFESILAARATGSAAPIVDDQDLSEMRGRGVEATTAVAATASDTQIILWDEPGGASQRSGQGVTTSYSVGQGNAQATSLTLQRY